ncbi:MAG: hypothetical protein A3E83_00140 [Gammaproteobacteria bacterium RIFCSPHIGHO2_12_FULL_41_20]|nr:MAG: hypothetical protein A3E83_00140 [Gammaproteobacteria bacterium RIFCSPHIGHO2_12_FULL_41_20]
MTRTVEVDIVILGGGVFGLWLLNRLRQAGFGAILFESNTLGGGQTYKSQGIIHGGMKYALHGNWTESAQTIADMPTVWKQCLEGKGDIDLSHVPIISPHQHLWSSSKLTTKLTKFFANFALKSRITYLEKVDYPSIFQHPDFKGEVYALDEMVIDIPALIRELAKPHQDVIFKISPFKEDQLHIDKNQNITYLEATTLSGEKLQIHAQRYVFAAGAGNEMIIKKLKYPDVAMQRRALHMVLVKIPFAHSLYAHCLSLGSMLPRITITTHQTRDNQLAWYIGGQLAEEGIHRDSKTQITTAQKELRQLFPWLDFSAAQFTSFMIDRIEPLQPNGKRPDGVFLKSINNMIIAWPTKLALAPKLTNDIMQHLRQEQLSPCKHDTRELRAWPIPPLAKPVWDELLC